MQSLKSENEVVDDVMDSDSQSSNSAEGISDDDNSIDEGKISEIQEQIKNNPYLYEAHVQLINLQRKLGDLEKVRNAREKMSKIFPLSPELWLDWLTDEEKLAVTESEKQSVIALFERAVKDYASVSVWLEFVQFTIGNMDAADGVESVRAMFERALTAVGINVTQGALIWEAYREFESVVLIGLKETSAEKDQQSRIYNLFKRQLSVPLMHMDETYREFQESFPDKDEPSLQQQFKKARQKLEKLKPFEDALFESEPPHLEEYRKYIQYEMEQEDPTRIHNLFERALLENCLVPDLWLEFTKYLDRVIKIETFVLAAHERAIRNCPWSVLCWKGYTSALERHNQPHETIKGAYEKALLAGFTEGEEFREIWLGYLDYLRRRIRWDQTHESELKELNDVFERATEHIMTYYAESDPQASVLQYWAKIEAKYCKNLTRAREIWNDIMNHGHHAEAEMWMNFASFERLYGDEKHYRKVLLKGLHSASDWPESLGNALLTFEREEGSLETLDSAIEKYDKQMHRVQERRQKAAEKEAEKQQKEAELKQKVKAEKRAAKFAAVHGQQSQSAKVSKTDTLAENDVKMDSEGFKIPSLPSRVQQVQDVKDHQSAVLLSSRSSKRMSDEDHHSERKRQKTEEDESEHGTSVKHDSSKDSRSVFLSNLAYTVVEDQIKEMFAKVGEIEEVRIVKDYKGRSKGYCYVVFSKKSDAEEALKKDRQRLDGRPVFVSRCEDKKQSAFNQQKFKFGTGLEKKKLFVKGLPFTTTEEELKDMFKEYGVLKDVRLVTYRNGHSKGLAYIEFEDEASAAAAIVKADNSKIGEHVISVAISNPPERKGKDSQSSSITVSSLLGGGGGTSSSGPRGRGRTQVSLVPRALQHPVVQQKPKAKPSQNSVQNGDSVNPENANSSSRMRNEDFRNMLLKK